MSAEDRGFSRCSQPAWTVSGFAPPGADEGLVQVIHPGQFQAERVALPQPLLNLFGLLPPAGLPPGLQFLEGVALHSRHSPAPMLTFQQSGQPTGLERLHPVKKTAAADAQLFGNLRGGSLPAGGQSSGEQLFPNPRGWWRARCCCRLGPAPCGFCGRAARPDYWRISFLKKVQAGLATGLISFKALKS